MNMEPVFTSVKCKNCSAAIEQNYCPSCGQHKNTSRLTVREVYQEFAQALFGLESGLFYTLHRLMLAPGKMVAEYLQGRRRPYMKPLPFHLLMLTAYFLLNTLLDIDIMKVTETMWNRESFDTAAAHSPEMKRLEKFNALFTSNIKVVTTIMVPCLCLMLLVFYRKARYFFTELLVFGLYVYGFTYLFFIVQSVFIALPLPGILEKSLFNGLMILSVVYLAFAIYQFYENKGLLKLLKALLAILASYVLYFFVFILCSLAYVLLFLEK